MKNKNNIVYVSIKFDLCKNLTVLESIYQKVGWNVSTTINRDIRFARVINDVIKNGTYINLINTDLINSDDLEYSWELI